MHLKMKFKIKNWLLACVAFILFCFLISLGCWQLSRAEQKKLLLQAFSARTQAPPLQASHLLKDRDLRFYRFSLEGSFDNQHTFLLDNKIFHGQVGYEIYTPFKLKNSTITILVDRGFVPQGPDRRVLPIIQSFTKTINLNGMLNLPPGFVSWGQMIDTHSIIWPLRIEFIQLDALEKLLNRTLFPYVLSLHPEEAAAYAMEWQIVSMTPERHLGYAIQWFALALTLLILFVVLNRDSNST
jgi:surfeit locus 1 family protein